MSRSIVALRILILLLIGIFDSSCRSKTSHVDTASVVLRFSTTGTPGGFGDALTHAFNARRDHVQLDGRTTVGSVANVRAVQEGRADIGLVAADVAYLAYTGQLKGETKPFDHIRAIAVLQLSPIQLIARTDSGIKKIEDIRGKHVAVGPDGSGTAVTANLVLTALGFEGSIRKEGLRFREAGERMRIGRLDAMFDNTPYSEWAAEGLASGAYHLVSIGGPPADQLQTRYPFLQKTVIPKDTYPGLDSVQTLGVYNLLVCRSDLDEEVIHAFTVSLFETVPTLPSSVRRNLADFDEASATPIPLHEGAARYYREIELDR
jgi:TRAP transporter TAXI family solute receptor